ncbi:hypothetical protein [Yunchengibacter salinarum]|uniref:hypothetical protein n=1 Tax=Yunchengibacter salinarum TaxID=3133399 RepID=UPI0035B60202
MTAMTPLMTANASPARMGHGRCEETRLGGEIFGLVPAGGTMGRATGTVVTGLPGVTRRQRRQARRARMAR